MLISAPFIYFTTRYAERLQLAKFEVLLTSVLLCILSLVFPSSIQEGNYVVWGLLAAGILILPWIFWVFRNREKMKAEDISYNPRVIISENEVACGQSVYTEVEEGIEVEERITEVEEGIEVEERITEVEQAINVEEFLSEVSEVREEKNLQLSLEESLEKGFQAKEAGHYQLAAEWFIFTLDRKPTADIAFYLIIDSYGLLTNILSLDEALNRVKPYIIEYFKSASPEWCIELMEWLDKEKIRINI